MIFPYKFPYKFSDFPIGDFPYEKKFPKDYIYMELGKPYGKKIWEKIADRLTGLSSHALKSAHGTKSVTVFYPLTQERRNYMSAERYFDTSHELARNRPTAEDQMVSLLDSIAYSLAIIAEYIEKKDLEEEES